VPLYQSDRANESVLIMKLGCTINLKAAVLPGHQLTGLVKKKKKKKNIRNTLPKFGRFLLLHPVCI
jgi:hypothetical protein